MHCVEKGYAKNIDIHYNTNGTQLPPKDIFDLWSYFKHVEIAFSIDDVGEPFEYQRHPAKWREVNQNLIKFKEMRTANMDFQICSTVSIFNVFNWAKIALWVAQFQPKFFYVNTCFDPDVFNIQTLPIQVKNIVVQTGVGVYNQGGEQYSKGFEAYLTANPVDGLKLVIQF